MPSYGSEPTPRQLRHALPDSRICSTLLLRVRGLIGSRRTGKACAAAERLSGLRPPRRIAISGRTSAGAGSDQPCFALSKASAFDAPFSCACPLILRSAFIADFRSSESNDSRTPSRAWLPDLPKRREE